MLKYLAQPFSGWARLNRRVRLVTLGVAVVVVGWGGTFAFRQIVPPSMADLTRDSCASVKAAGPGADWQAVPSTDVATIASLMRSRRLATGRQVGMLDTPVLVHPFAIHTHYGGNDCPHWIASTHVADGQHMEVYDFIYDYPHQRMRASGVGFPQEGSPVYANGFPAVSLNRAEALLQAQRHVQPSGAWTPELVFFALQDGWSTTPSHTQGTQIWNEGGADPSDPMWLMLGNDGWPYLIGTSQHVYAINELPIDR